MKNDCEAIRDRLGAYGDGELDPVEAGRVAEHLKRCAACRQELAEIRYLHQMMGELHPDGLGEEHAERVRIQVGRRVRARMEPLEYRHRAARIPWLGLASAAAGLIVVVVIVAGGLLPLAGRRAERSAAVPAGKAEGTQTLAGDEVKAAMDREGQAAPRTTAKAASGYGGAAAPAGRASAGAPTDRVGIAPLSKPEPTAQTGAVPSEPAAAPPAPAAELRVSGARKLAVEAARLEEPAYDAVPAPLAAAGVDADTLAGLLQWPAQPGAAAESGNVVLRVLVQPNGTASEVLVSRSSGRLHLDSLALRLALKATYQPLVEDGERVESWLDVPYRFVPQAESEQ